MQSFSSLVNNWQKRLSGTNSYYARLDYKSFDRKQQSHQ